MEGIDEFVDVFVSLDISHVMGISVKSNSMEMLVGIELEWYDGRLSWDPFLGGCNRASFRASVDADLTEIWVPDFELINMAERDIASLPEAHASVMYNGRVRFRCVYIVAISLDIQLTNYHCLHDFLAGRVETQWRTECHLRAHGY